MAFRPRIKVSQYKDLVRAFLSNNEHRFAVMVIDRNDPGYDGAFFKTTWEAYTSYLATLVSRELVNLGGKEIFLVLDELPKPKTITQSLEEVVMEKIAHQCSRKYSSQTIGTVGNCIRVESHSNLAMQLCDVLLGAVMFDYKKSAGLVSKNLQNKKEPVVDVLRTGLGRTKLDEQFTVHRPVYFHVWNAVWK